MLSRFKTIALLGILAGPVLAYIGWKEKAQLARIQSEGVTVPGIIEGGETRRGRRGSKSYKMDVSYQPQGGGNKIQKKFTVKSDYVTTHVANDEITNDKAEVRYLPSDPSQAIIVGGSTNSTAMLPIGGAWAAIGLLTGATVAFRKKTA